MSIWMKSYGNKYHEVDAELAHTWSMCGIVLDRFDTQTNDPPKDLKCKICVKRGRKVAKAKID